MLLEAAAAGESGLGEVFNFAALHVAMIAGTVALGVDVHSLFAGVVPALG
jgi:hypothetical protein